MSREVTTPLVLWIFAAVCAHFVVGQGGWVVAKVHDDKREFRELAQVARESVSGNAPLEFTVDDSSEAAPPPEEEQKPEEAKPDDPKDEKLEEKKKVEPPKPPPPPPKPEIKKVEPPKPPPPKPEPPKKEPPKIAVVPKPPEEERKVTPLVAEKKISVVQKDANNKDNPDAKFQADQANTVKEEKVATITNTQRDDRNPTPGGQHSSAEKKVGDSDRTRIRDDEDRKGEKDRAPGDKGTETASNPVPPSTATTTSPAPAGKPAAPPADGRPPSAPKVALKPVDPPAPAPGSKEAGPQATTSPNGGFTIKVFREPAATVTPARPGRKGTPVPVPSALTKPMFGLNSGPAQLGRVNPNANHTDVVAAVGVDQLRKMRAADGERIKSAHRGSFKSSNFERWRSAIENYVANVKPGNQTALNTAAVPFGTYINTIHNRIHPIFADSFLGSLDGLPKEHPLSNMKMQTHLEIVLTKDGRIQKMGVTKTSGVTQFDLAALDSVDRAQPFGTAPDAIVSPDGYIYLHWEFHRDEVFACSTLNAHPFLLNTPAKPAAPPEPPPPAPSGPTRERGLPPVNTPEIRHGARESAPARRSAS